MPWTDLHPKLWIHDYPLSLLGVRMSAKSILIKKDNKGLVLISPGKDLDPIDPEFGRIEAIVCPNSFHHIYLPYWAAKYPQAELFAPASVQKRYPQLRFKGSLVGNDLPFGSEVDVDVVTQNPRYEEYSFYHRPSRTLILTDICFNIERETHAWSRLFWKLWGVYGKVSVPRLAKRMVQDKSALKANMGRILDRTIKTIVVAHGDVMTKAAKDRVREAIDGI